MFRSCCTVRRWNKALVVLGGLTQCRPGWATYAYRGFGGEIIKSTAVSQSRGLRFADLPVVAKWMTDLKPWFKRIPCPSKFRFEHRQSDCAYAHESAATSAADRRTKGHRVQLNSLMYIRRYDGLCNVIGCPILKFYCNIWPERVLFVTVLYGSIGDIFQIFSRQPWQKRAIILWSLIVTHAYVAAAGM